MKIRAFNVGDVFTVVKMISAIAGKAGKDLRTAFSSSSTDVSGMSEAEKEAVAHEQGIELMMFIIDRCFDAVEDQLKAWFASLCGMKKDEFLALPADSVLDVVDQIVTQDGAKDFFSKAYQLYKKMNGFASSTNGK